MVKGVPKLVAAALGLTLAMVLVVVLASTSFADATTGPTVAHVKPAKGPAAGGNPVVIAGQGFTGASAVMFGSTAATSFKVVSPHQIVAKAPAGDAGAVDVTVTTKAGTSATGSGDQYTYVAAVTPTVAHVKPAKGPAAGGNPVVIAGQGFTGASAVMFGSTAATSFKVVSPHQIVAKAPAGDAGAVDVTVTTKAGTSATGSGDQYTYVAK